MPQGVVEEGLKGIKFEGNFVESIKIKANLKRKQIFQSELLRLFQWDIRR